jgi:methylmalonyl-CoA/ethylmalonyl-CoA epimerase
MSDLIDRFTKINIRVKSMSATRELFEDLLGAELIHDRGSDTIGDFDGTTLRLGGVVFDLMAPNKADGALAKSIEKRGEGLDSICFNVKSLSTMRQRLAEKGIELVNYNEHHGTKVAFIHPRDACGIVIELIEPASPNR